MNERASTAVLLGLSAAWFGLLIGVSFVATPAKFLAPSLSLPVALDVGRQTFAVFNRIEWVLAAALLPAIFLARRSIVTALAAACTLAIIATETLWLLPLLDERVGMIIAGQAPTPSGHHLLYIWLEGIKALALATIAAVGARQLVKPSHA